jgi:hypothetical protein
MQKNLKKCALALALSTVSSGALAYEDLITQTPGQNWKGSLIAEFIGYRADEYHEIELPGFLSAGHAHGFNKGLSIGHWEVVLTGDINQHLTSRFVGALFYTQEEGTQTELEEAWIQTKALGRGLKMTAGRMYTELGYHTSKHNHEWDFADQPWVITGLFGSHPLMDGLRVNWVAPTDRYIELGLEAQNGKSFPAGGSGGELGGIAFTAKTGGDLSHSSSWQAGAGLYRASGVKERTVGHEHDGEYHEDRFSGDVKMANLNAVYKWAPNGNVKERNLTLQAEYFYKEEDGTLFHLHDKDVENLDNIPGYKDTLYTGKQKGYYAQAVYQFRPMWRVGYRYERLETDNALVCVDGGCTVGDVTDIHGFVNDEKPTKQSVMLDWSPSHYSRLRLQVNREETHADEPANLQWIVQYSHSFGAHGAHAY